MTRPPTLIEAQIRGLAKEQKPRGVHTFSNGTSWTLWADVNCFECWHWDEEQAGARCAFEGAALLDWVTPDLARMFGWTQSVVYPDSWHEPQQCPYFRAKRNDDGDDNPPPPDPDPRQLVLLADPKEDAAIICAPARVREEMAV